jgi:hypothetical protein
MDRPNINQRHAGNLLVAIWLVIVPPAIVIAIYLNLPSYAFTVNAGILPKYFYFVFSLLLIPLVFLKVKNFTAYLVSPIAIWALALLALNCVHLLADVNGSAESHNRILSRIQTIGVIILLAEVGNAVPLANFYSNRNI